MHRIWTTEGANNNQLSKEVERGNQICKKFSVEIQTKLSYCKFVNTMEFTLNNWTMMICIHYSQVVLKGQIYSALVINNQFSAKYISIFHPQVFSERTNLLWRKAVTSQRHSRSAWQQPLKSTLSQELHSNVQCHLGLLAEICVTLRYKLSQKQCVTLEYKCTMSQGFCVARHYTMSQKLRVTLQYINVRCFAWLCNTQCHSNSVWQRSNLLRPALLMR